MIEKTRKLLLSTLGGALVTIGILSFYNAFRENYLVYGIPSIIFLIVGGLVLKKAFD